MPARGEKGIAALEFALIFPVLLVMVFAIIDVGRLIQARLIITNVSREGGSLAFRGAMPDAGLILMLQQSGQPLDLDGSGRIWISRIHAGTAANYNPVIFSQYPAGMLGVPSSINYSSTTLGLSLALYDYLKFQPGYSTSQITQVTVVEVYYQYKPITPLPRFISNILSKRIGSRAVF